MACARVEAHITKRRVYSFDSSPSEYCASTDSLKRVSSGARRMPERSMVRTERDAKFLNGARMAGAIDPLSCGRRGRLSQDRIAAQHFDGLHISLGPDGELEAYGPSNIQALQSVGVFRLDPRD